MPATDDGYQHPTKNCDLVMKGGIASGVVYPAAVLELAPTYRFCGIGGTSVGAIAAAAVAAAEYGRESGGFGKLKDLNDWLGGVGNIRSLFQPDAETRPLMDTILLALEKTPVGEAKDRPTSPLAKGVRFASQTRSLLSRSDPEGVEGGGRLGLLVGLGVALALALLAYAAFALLGGGAGFWGATALFLVLATVLGALGNYLGGVIGSGVHLARIAFEVLPGRGFGLCTGRTAGNGGPGLTDWLHDRLRDIADLPDDRPVLTFGMIRRKGKERGVPFELAMMTTDLSHQSPWRLPFDQHLFLFRPDEMRAYFPDVVVEHMIAHAFADDRHVLPEGFLFLPSPDDLPVVFGARLSLSLPGVFRAVKLYTIPTSVYADASRKVDGCKTRVLPGDFRVTWFSDGGIVSNFPIHFFDDWLPSWPTFGINLGELPEGAFSGAKGEARKLSSTYRTTAARPEPVDSPPPEHAAQPTREQTADDASHPIEDVDLPRPNAPISLDWKPIDGVLPFAASIFHAAKNQRETIQSTLPSYRDRIVQVRLSPDEGGLNLDMPPAIVARMVEKGHRAGAKLRDDFRLDHHRWVRYRVLMAHLEDGLRSFGRVYSESRFDDLIAQATAPDSRYPYHRRPAGWPDRAAEISALLRRLILLDWPLPATDPDHPDLGFFNDKDTPKPITAFRVTPRD